MTSLDKRPRGFPEMLAGQPGTSIAGYYSLPAAGALLSRSDGLIVDATPEAATLGGEHDQTGFIGRRLGDVVVRDGALSRMRRSDGDILVRTVSWSHHECPQLRVTVLVDVSDLAKPESALDAATLERNRLVEAQRLARVGSWVYYPDTCQIYRSAVLEELRVECGLEQPEHGPVLAPHPHDREKIDQFHEKLMASTPDRLIETEVRDPSGHRVFLLTGRVEHDRSGRIDRLQGTVQDVTERRQLESQLRDQRRKLHDAQRLARLGTWEWDPATNEVRLSEVLHELTLCTPGTRTDYETVLAGVHADDRPSVERELSTLAEGGGPIEVEHRFVRPDGALRVFRAHGAVVEDADGNPLVVGTAQDVTEQNTAVTRMQRSSQRFVDLVAVTPVGIGLFDQSERLVDANDALGELLGYRLELLYGRTMGELAHPREPVPELTEMAVETRTAGGRGMVPQRSLVRFGGGEVDCELHVSLSVQDDGTKFWLVVFQDVTERRRAAETLHYQATHDDLTGLPNRSAVKDSLAQLLTQPNVAEIAVLFCDIDNFKRVNDSLGHDAGDELLIVLARRLEGGLPEGCTAARLSGDEFVIICSDLSAVGGVDSLATKVSVLLRNPVPVHGQLVRVTASIGAAVPAGAGTEVADLLRFADAAMFEAKQRGTGKVSLAGPSLIASADRQVHLEGQLREALHNDGLTLFYQPIVGSDGVIVSAEALVRWPHPERGLLTPDVFLPIAEQGDLLRDLDRWVLCTALREAVSWPQRGGTSVGISVNLGGLVPGGPDFVNVVGDTVADCGIDCRRVVLELVETALVDLPSRTRQAMGELVGRGIRFAVDDFGTGYSSLARLKDLPAQIIKVDRRFVSGIDTDASDFAVTRAVIDMARAMGRQCVAEGVETATQLRMLSGVGVDAYQGWLFSRAVPATEFREVLASGPLHTPVEG